MSEATSDRALAGNEEEEEVLPPEPTTKSIILGEVVGCFLLSVLGLGIGVSATLWGAPGAPWFAAIWPTAAGWALTIALGIYVTATLSGAHFNPAVTITLAVTGRHPWRLVPLYILCQLIGWFLGAAVLMAMFGRNLFDFAASKNMLASRGGCITSALTEASAVEVVGAVLGTVHSRTRRGLAALATR